MSTICNKTTLKTDATGFFDDLVDSMALQCKQVDMQDKEGLFVIAGKIKLDWNTTSNTLSWDTASTVGGINAAGESTLAFGNTGGSNPMSIDITYPTRFTAGALSVRPIATFAGQGTSLMYFNDGIGDWLSFSVAPNANFTRISLERSFETASKLYYNGGWLWGGDGQGISGSHFAGTSVSMAGTGLVTVSNLPFQLKSIPTLTPFYDGTTRKLPMFNSIVSPTSFDFLVWNLSTPGLITTAANGNYACIDFGPYARHIDAEVTRFEDDSASFWFYGLYQSY